MSAPTYSKTVWPSAPRLDLSASSEQMKITITKQHLGYSSKYTVPSAPPFVVLLLKRM
ncbi:MAG: hypothetical protein ACTHKP_09385 [Nitrososphaeraceae archaeon]